MTIQDFSEALNERESSLHQAFDELRQAGVRHAIENPPPGTDAGGWVYWG